MLYAGTMKGCFFMSEKQKRTRNWAFLVYPESIVSNWRDILDELHTPWFESPIHDKDIDPTGQPKKAHIHIILCFENHKSYNQIIDITSSINASYPQPCENVRGYVRYFCHIDNPDKFQYNIDDIICHCGADLQQFFKPNSTLRYQYIRDMIDFINDYNIIEFNDFMLIAMQSHYDDWFPLLCDNSAFVIREVIKSKRHSYSNQHQRLAFDKLSGEVFEEIR